MDKIINEFEANQMMTAAGINCATSYLVNSTDELNELLNVMDFPIVMKLLSADVLHRSDIGCVFVGVINKDEAILTFDKIIYNAKAYNKSVIIDGVIVQEIAPKGVEVIIGYRNDDAFGPVMMVGSGGIYVEVFQDVSWKMLPLDETEVSKMIGETKLFEIINGARGKKYDIDYLKHCILSLQKYVMENEEIVDLEINPLFLYEVGKNGIAVDALIKITDNSDNSEK